MEFWYDVIESYRLYIDFQEIYDYIESEGVFDTEDIYASFYENVGFYLRSIYGCEDFYEDDNELQIEELLLSWNKWFDNKFGENWNK